MPLRPAPHIDPAARSAWAARVRGWLVAFAAWLIERLGARTPLGRALSAKHDAELRAAARAVRALAFLHACDLLDWSRPRRRRTAPPFAPPGARRVRARGGTLKRLTRGFAPGLNRGSFTQRAARLRNIIDDIARHGARLARRIQRGVPAWRLAPGAHAPIMLAATAPAPCARADDSS